METVLTHLNHRIRHRYQLNKAIPIVEQYNREIEEEFFVFFDDLIDFCKKEIEELS
jgi:hypothetical protein